METTLVIFHLGRRVFALDVDCVAQVIPMLKLTPMPQVQEIVEGVANIRGNVVPVLSVRKCLGINQVPPKLNTPIILTFVGDKEMGLIVDEVIDVVYLEDQQMIQAQEMVPDEIENPPIIKGAFYFEGKAVIVIDPRYLLNPLQVAALNRALEKFEKHVAESEGKAEGTAIGEENGNVLKRGRMLRPAAANQIAEIAADMPPFDRESTLGSPDAIELDPI